MRHLKAHRKLGRTSTHRKALFKNMSIALINEGKIETTEPKAKELKSYFEKLLTKARKGDLNAHRLVFSRLQEKAATKKLVTEIAPKYADRKGGYLTIQKTGTRLGDAAPMAVLALV
ncbi:MAG: 50S ribosomal protein L17 [Helicobacteraceae bacterium]|jgi:large subunit ribosomal protein L17|nr:50S ribosomal protein L17 [Helicobacteraceae bacterium]